MSSHFAPVIVGGREIPVATIAAEAQHHPAHNADTAWAAAAEALVVKQLLLDEAGRCSISPGQATDGEGRLLADDDDELKRCSNRRCMCLKRMRLLLLIMIATSSASSRVYRSKWSISCSRPKRTIP